jgi:hypothetical protein
MTAADRDGYGLLAEFDTAADLLDAAHRARDEGYTRMDAYTPLPVEGLREALGHPRTRLPLAVLAGGFLGAVSAYALQYYTLVVSYPLDIGGRAHHAWPAFVVITFELTILSAAIVAVVGMLGRNGLPCPYHPLFNVERFALASRDRFFLCIESSDPRYDPEETRGFLASLGSGEVSEVAR